MAGVTDSYGARRHGDEPVCDGSEVATDAAGCHDETSDGPAYHDQE